MDEMTQQFDLPGFRFHPTEEELLDFYLKNMVFGKKSPANVIGYLNIYRHDPWHLPELAKIGEREWYFFVPRDRKHGTGGRPNRTTEVGFWKATGSDRKIVSLSDPKRVIGLRKTLVFYKGRAPSGSKTDWVMNEYRLPDSCPLPKDIVLCKIYRKATSLKVLEQRAMEGDQMRTTNASPSSSPPSSWETKSFCSQQEDLVAPEPIHNVVCKEEVEDIVMVKENGIEEKPREDKWSSLQLPLGKEKLELEVPRLSMDWTTDNFLLSPWLLNLTHYADVLNF
ncbi:hypothetical protein Tsubulata_025363 [Turnera subulata]|uniref:NAC domain-containing protein n=1 Tax=Turnera subulata TaxID=218843 RepID=A0A9Q0FY19_9ROSI|nr:hypothetical protein Tsubulata_025363 [Turnera subulata]